MGIKQVITDRIRRLRGGDSLELSIAAIWRDLVDALPEDGVDEAMRAELDALRVRLDEAGLRIDSALVKDLISSQHRLAVAFHDLVLRGKMITESSRATRRTVSASSLRIAQLEDELGRIRTIIRDECRRRGIRIPSNQEDAAVSDELYKVFEGISGRGSRRMQSVGKDPILTELLALVDTADVDAIRRFPRWLQGPAGRILDLVAERDRYRKLLERQGLLPPK